MRLPASLAISTEATASTMEHGSTAPIEIAFDFLSVSHQVIS